MSRPTIRTWAISTTILSTRLNTAFHVLPGPRDCNLWGFGSPEPPQACLNSLRRLRHVAGLHVLREHDGCLGKVLIRRGVLEQQHRDLDPMPVHTCLLYTSPSPRD